MLKFHAALCSAAPINSTPSPLPLCQAVFCAPLLPTGAQYQSDTSAAEGPGPEKHVLLSYALRPLQQVLSNNCYLQAGLLKALGVSCCPLSSAPFCRCPVPGRHAEGPWCGQLHQAV